MYYPTPSYANTLPKSPNLHLVSSSDRNLMLDVEKGRILELEPQVATEIKAALLANDTGLAEEIAMKAGYKPAFRVPAPIPKSVAVRSLSLAIAQKCNLGCTYCYAEQGTFGGRPNNMTVEVAKAAVDRLIADTPTGEKITLAFMGGEPLFNRSALHEVTEYAKKESVEAGLETAFTITTNATLILPQDVELFQKYHFTVTVSIDGVGESNDTLRPYISGKGSFSQVKKKLRLLFGVPDRAFQVLARVTVTPRNLDLPNTFLGLLEMGFDSVQFSPMLKSPTGKEEMAKEDFATLLKELITCGEIFRQGFRNRELLPLKNVLSTMARIHNYQREMYPCGAGGGYMGVSSDGELYACHRFVNDEEGHLGNLEDGIDPKKQGKWLSQRHLEAQGSACNSCWARYMCSGSCHHEVIKRGRPACDYIRGWLDYCMGLYADLMKADPIGLYHLLGDSTRLEELSENQDGTSIEF